MQRSHGLFAIAKPLVNIICSLGKPHHKANPLLWFYNTGLGSRDGVNDKKWPLKTFPTLLYDNNHTQVCRHMFVYSVIRDDTYMSRIIIHCPAIGFLLSVKLFTTPVSYSTAS